jgi:hypothetical protein
MTPAIAPLTSLLNRTPLSRHSCAWAVIAAYSVVGELRDRGVLRRLDPGQPLGAGLASVWIVFL